MPMVRKNVVLACWMDDYLTGVSNTYSGLTYSEITRVMIALGIIHTAFMVDKERCYNKCRKEAEDIAKVFRKGYGCDLEPIISHNALSDLHFMSRKCAECLTKGRKLKKQAKSHEKPKNPVS